MLVSGCAFLRGPLVLKKLPSSDRLFSCLVQLAGSLHKPILGNLFPIAP